MNWKKFFNYQKKSSAAAPLLVQWGAHQPRFTPRHYDTLAEEGFQKNVIAYRCIKLVSQTAAAVPFIVTRRRHRLAEHPLLDLLQRPNPVQGGAALFESLFAFSLIAGNSYLEAVGPAGASPRELWTLRPDRMKVIPGAQSIPEAYRYTVGGRAVDFAVDPLTGRAPVLHIKSFHPLDDWYGMSPLEAAAVSVDQHNDAAKWNAALLQTSGRPSGALVYRPAHADAPDTLTDQQRQTLKAEMEKYFSGADNAGRPLVLEGGLDWKEMSLSPKDMDWLAGKDVSAREIALAFHVPAQLIGIAGSQTYANFEQARLALFDDAVLPLLDHVKDALNNWLAPQFGDNLRIGFDLDKVEALAPRRAETWARLASADFLTVNEKRVALGFPPLPEEGAVEEGDAEDPFRRKPQQQKNQHKYNRNQPRVPAGSSTGGQWSGGGSGGGGGVMLPQRRPARLGQPLDDGHVNPTWSPLDLIGGVSAGARRAVGAVAGEAAGAVAAESAVATQALKDLSRGEAATAVKAAYARWTGKPLAAYESNAKIKRAADSIEEYLGGPGVVIRNKKTGNVTIERGNKKVRFDTNNLGFKPDRVTPEEPHFQFEGRTEHGNWRSRGDQHRYPFKKDK